jgi:hypothetical protein
MAGEQQQNVISVTANQLSALTKGIKLGEIRQSMPQLEALCNHKIEATEEFSDLCRLVALKAGINPSVLATYITAVCNDTLKKKEMQTEQLTLLFEELS